MAFPLTVNKLMGLCAFEAEAQKDNDPRPDHIDVVRSFYKQMNLITEQSLDRIYERMFECADELGFAVEPADDFGDLPVTIIQSHEKDLDEVQLFPKEVYIAGAPISTKGEPIVGLFRSKHFTARIGTTLWDLRIRPSVTACILERDDRLSKIWWTLEGVPKDQKTAPTEADSIRFIDITTAMAEKALPELRDAYIEALKEVTKRERGNPLHPDTQLRVSFADNADKNFAYLIDAMSLTSVKFQEALDDSRQENVRRGAGEVRSFVEKTVGMVDPKGIRIKPGRSGLAAVFAEAVQVKPPVGTVSQISPKDTSKTDSKWVISGLASSIGMVPMRMPTDPPWMRMTAAPDLARSLSAARPLSAMIADAGARQMEHIRPR